MVPRKRPSGLRVAPQLKSRYATPQYEVIQKIVGGALKLPPRTHHFLPIQLTKRSQQSPHVAPTPPSIMVPVVYARLSAIITCPIHAIKQGFSVASILGKRVGTKDHRATQNAPNLAIMQPARHPQLPSASWTHGNGIADEISNCVALLWKAACHWYREPRFTALPERVGE